MLVCGSSREQMAAKKVLSTPPENPTATVPSVRRCSASALSLSCWLSFMVFAFVISMDGPIVPDDGRWLWQNGMR